MSRVQPAIKASAIRALRALERFFAAQPGLPAGRGDRLIVAFSGGPDSTALLSAAVCWGESRGVDVLAAHLDHALDDGSAARARQARALAERLQASWHCERIEVASLRKPGQSLEAAARRARYGFLFGLGSRQSARWIATAHHRDDQAETVAMRLLSGSGLEGLAGIAPRRGPVIRPLLGLGRADILADLVAAGLRVVEDPTNREPRALRNRLRATTLPALRDQYPAISAQMAALAEAVCRARPVVERALLDRLRPRCRLPLLRLASDGPTVVVDRAAFRKLPGALRPHALSLLHRLAGVPYPASSAARGELSRQLTAMARVGCDCGGGWRWEGHGGELTLSRSVPPTRRFSYTLVAPGEIDLPEVGARFRLSRGPRAAWMLERWPDRAGLALPIEPGESVTIRNRRPGDRVQPLGSSKPRRLKEILIDNRVPRSDRDRLPLLAVAGQVLWVPGVAVSEACRLDGRDDVWVAQVESRNPTSPNPVEGDDRGNPPPIDRHSKDRQV